MVRDVASIVCEGPSELASSARLTEGFSLVDALRTELATVPRPPTAAAAPDAAPSAAAPPAMTMALSQSLPARDRRGLLVVSQMALERVGVSQHCTSIRMIDTEMVERAYPTRPHSYATQCACPTHSPLWCLTPSTERRASARLRLRLRIFVELSGMTLS